MGRDDLVRDATVGVWPVMIVETDGLWPTYSDATLLLIAPSLGPAAVLLLHRLVWTYPTRWTTDDLADQLGLFPTKTVAALERLALYGHVSVEHDRTGELAIMVPSRLGPLTQRNLGSLPARLKQLHARLADQHAAAREPHAR